MRTGQTERHKPGQRETEDRVPAARGWAGQVSPIPARASDMRELVRCANL